MCILNLNSLPPARVLLDGKPLGFTPKIGVLATPGGHRVVFHWEDRDKPTTVTCAKGEAKTVAVRLSDTSPEDERLERNPYR
jgi:serine/threonine-protein kinase